MLPRQASENQTEFVPAEDEFPACLQIGGIAPGFSLTGATGGTRTDGLNPAGIPLRPPTCPLLRAMGLFLVLACAALRAQEPEITPRTNNNFEIRASSNGVFEIGLVRLDRARRALTLPAFVNLREGALEYVLVSSNGKTHESLLRTDAEPYQIHIAMLLLGAGTAGTNALPEGPPDALPGEKISVEIAWKKKSRSFRLPAETFILDRKRKSALRKGPCAIRWVHHLADHGSRRAREQSASGT
jgi:hypothetical protein